MATTMSSFSQPNSTVKTNELCAVIKGDIYQHFDELRRVYEENRPKSYDQLLKKGLICHLSHDQPFEKIINQLLATILILDSNIQELEASCQKFLSAMVWFGLDPKKTTRAIELSRDLRENWRELAADLGIQSFLSVETLPSEEINLLCKLKVKPLENLIEIPDEDAGKRLQKNADWRNKAALVIQKHCNKIIKVMADDENIAEDFADTLCRNGLIRPARKDQVLQISNRTIRAKGIVSEVCIGITTGVVPDRHLNTFVNALKQNSSLFSEVIRHFENEGYTGRDDNPYMSMPTDNQTEYCRHNSRPNRNAVDHADYQYIGYLRSDYTDNLNPAFFINGNWKFYDLSTRTSSGLEQRLDLKRLPQRYKSNGKFRSLIVGAPGVGKSSIVTELCKGWVRGYRLRQYKYVIRIDASQGNSVNKLEDLIPCSTSIACIKQAFGENTLFIIDGFDEFNEESREQPDSFYNKLFQSKIPSLYKASLIVTARPHCANKIREYFPALVEILGFTDSSKERYLSSHLRANDKRVKERLSNLKPTVEFCMNIPFLLATLIEIINEDDNDEEISKTSPETLTKLYGVLIRTHILNYTRENDLERFLPQCAFRIEPGEFASQLPQNIYIPFLKLCALAYKTVSDNSTNDIRDLQYDFKLAIRVSRYTTTGRKVEYKFLHSSVQEYLAAYCISRMSNEKREKSIRFLMDRFSQRSDQYNLVLEFLHGFKCIRQDHIQDHNQYKKVTSFGVIRQLCEINSPEFIRNLYNPLNEQHRKEHGVDMHCILMRTWPLPTPGDLWYLGRVIALSGQYWELNFTFRPIRDAHLKMLCEGINSAVHTVADDSQTMIGKLERIGLSLTKITKDGLPHIFKINQNCLSHIQDLRLDSIDLGQDAIDFLSNSLPTLINLKRFLFHHNNIRSHKQLLIALEICPCLKHVSFTNLYPEEYELLLQLPLKILELWRISTISCEALFRMLPTFRTCEDLEVYQTEISIDSARILQQCLPWSKLKHLKLVNCDINDVIVDLLVEAVATTYAIRNTKPLKSLDLCDNFITDVGGEKILDIHQRFGIDLRETYLYNSFSDDMANKLEMIYEACLRHRESIGEHASSYSINRRVGLETF